MIENIQDSIILAAGIIILCAIVIGVVLVVMCVYFEVTDWASNVRVRFVRGRDRRRAERLRQEDANLEALWQEHKRVCNLANATLGDKQDFFARMRRYV